MGAVDEVKQIRERGGEVWEAIEALAVQIDANNESVPLAAAESLNDQLRGL